MVDLRKWMDESQQAGDMSGINVCLETMDEDNDKGMIFFACLSHVFRFVCLICVLLLYLFLKNQW